MKKLLFIMMLIPIVGVSQIRPYGHIEYSDYLVSTYTKFPKISITTFNFPKISTKLGIEYTYKNAFIAADANVFSNYYSGKSLNPELAFYDVKIGYHITKKIRIELSHRCIHTITSDFQQTNQKMFGGGDKIGIYLN